MFALKPIEAILLLIVLVAVWVAYRLANRGKSSPPKNAAATSPTLGDTIKKSKIWLKVFAVWLGLLALGVLGRIVNGPPRGPIPGQSQRDAYANKLNQKYEYMIGPWGRSPTRSPGFSAKGRALLVDVNERYSTEGKVRFWAGLFANWDGSTGKEQRALCDLGFDRVEFSSVYYSLGCNEIGQGNPDTTKKNP